MHILIVNNGVIPVSKYGGAQRSVWWLGRALTQLGVKVSYLVSPGSTCPFADVYFWDQEKSVNDQIPDGVDLVHFQQPLKEEIIKVPYVVTIRGNAGISKVYDLNTIFISRNHAERYGSTTFVYNCIDPDDYGTPDFSSKREYVHFLAKAAWKVKNVRGAIKIARKGGEKLRVLGGDRLNFKMGFRFTTDLNTRFEGMVGGEKKLNLIQGSKGLLFPVLWHEPFGLAIIESMYCGCPVIGTNYGSLPELVGEFGVLSNSESELIEGVRNLDAFDRKKCSEFVADTFNPINTAKGYIPYYEKVLRGEKLNKIPPQLQQEQKTKLLPITD